MAGPYERGYNDPAIAKSFDNLAKMYAPPSATDVYAGAKAQEVRQKMEGIARLYGIDPSTNPTGYDQAGVAAGLYAPTQGFGARNMGDETKRFGIGVESGDRRRGQDLESGDRRYNVDQRTISDRYQVDEGNKTKIATTGMEQRGQTDRTMLGPVAKDATRFVPPDIAEMYKVPQQQTGIVAAQPGEKNFVPGPTGAPGAGPVLEGNPKPKTEAEVKGGIIAGLSPEEQRAVGFGSTPLETSKDTGKPISRPDALATGTAVVDRTHAAQVFNYRTGDGKIGTARLDPATNAPVDSVTDQPLPQGSILQAPSGVQNQNGLGPTTANTTAANQKSAQLDVMDQTLNAYEHLVRNNPGVVGIPGAVRGAAQNAVSVVDEFAGSFGNIDPNVKVTADQVKAIAGHITQGRDPAIQQARVLEADLAYKLAQAQNPTGEVSRQAFERALDVVAGGTLRNNQTAIESIGALRDMVKRERSGVASLRAPGGAAPGAAPQQGVAPAPAGPKVYDTPAGKVTVTPVQ